MSSIEERLAKMDHMITVWEGREISPNQKYTVDGCEAYDLALQLAGLLREMDERMRICTGHWNNCGIRTGGGPCSCGWHELLGRMHKALDGKEGT